VNVVIIGCGRVGSRLAATLADRGDAVTVVDQLSAALDRLGTRPGVTGVAGDGCDRAVLARAGVDRADGLAAVTGSDEVNAVVARLAATRLGVPRVVARIYDPAKAEIYRRLGVQTIAPITWGADRLAELLTHSELTPVASLGTGQVEIVEVTVPALLAGRPAGELTIPGETQVVAITRHGTTVLAGSTATPLEAGDIAHLAVTATTRLDALLGRD
jgi:trk system potassium uptake protein